MRLASKYCIRAALIFLCILFPAAWTAPPLAAAPARDWNVDVRIECLGGVRASWEAHESISGFHGRIEAALDLGWETASSLSLGLSGLVRGDFRPDVRFGHVEGELNSELTLLPEWTTAVSLYSAASEGSDEFEDFRLLRGRWRTEVEIHPRLSIDLAVYVETESLFRLPRTDRNTRLSAGASLVASREPLLLFSMEGGLDYTHSTGSGESGTAPDVLFLCLFEPGKGITFLLATQVRHVEQFDGTRFDSAWIAVEGKFSLSRRAAIKLLIEYYTGNGNESSDDDRFIGILAGLELTF